MINRKAGEFKRALEEIKELLSKHSTNRTPNPPTPDEAGYDAAARYAYLVAKEALK